MGKKKKMEGKGSANKGENVSELHINVRWRRKSDKAKETDEVKGEE